ncbi:MAG: ABC transporter ATP-binding protein [Thermoanaerobaculaceae bacterium]|nr:ABC transporter ATP-binding protein [Thermoanaerobaculaceae bacterium]
MLKIVNISKKFDKIEAVSNLNISVREGEIYGFLGPNGAGKTTTLRICTGLLQPDEGFVEINGEKAALDKVEFRKAMAYIPDRPYLYEKLTGWEYLNFVSEIRGTKNWEEKAEYYFEFFELKESIHRLIEGFSHGMKQKLVIISSILHDPKLLLIDEPMVGLDPKSSRKVRELFKRLSSDGVALVLSTHSLDVAEELSHRIGIINRGKLVAEGTMAELIEQSKTSNKDLESVFLKLTEEGDEVNEKLL